MKVSLMGLIMMKIGWQRGMILGQMGLVNIIMAITVPMKMVQKEMEYLIWGNQILKLLIMMNLIRLAYPVFTLRLIQVFTLPMMKLCGTN